MCVKIVLLCLFETIDVQVAVHENCMTH